MITLQVIRKALAATAPLSEDEQRDVAAINMQCAGWSSPAHYVFFRALLTQFSVRSVLMLGVYFGRDIAYFCNAAHRLGYDDFYIVGVDKFASDFCEDWPEQFRGRSWEENGFGASPDHDKATGNLKTLGFGNFRLIKARDDDYLANANETYDLIYIDTSHDEATVRRQILSSQRVVKPGGIIAGDDYSDQDTWGVIRAVKSCCTDHAVFANWLWATSPACVKPKTGANATPTHLLVHEEPLVH